MRVDTNRALMLSMPYSYFALGWRHRGALYRASGLVLEHRMQAGYFLFIPHNVHTPGRGGPAHVGISALIRRGYRYPWMALNAIPWTTAALHIRARLNATIFTEESAGLGAFEIDDEL
jgi:hypothetical protein